jgi:4-hydroxymandelate oxidase
MAVTRREAMLGGAAVTALSLGAGASGQVPTSTPAILDDIVSLPDMEQAAKKVMSHMAYEFVASGAGDEHTLRWNIEAYTKMRLRPRILQDVARTNTEVSLFGRTLPSPILLAPTAYHRLYHADGELGTSRGAGAAGAPYVVSTNTTTPIEDIARVAKAPLWFQLYIQTDRGFTKEVVQRAEAAGCEALCLTVDAPTGGPRNRQQKAKFKLPPNLSTPYMRDRNTGRRTDLLGDRPSTETWKDVEWLRSFSKVPLLLKGVMTGNDARRGLATGADGIVVSNHGGRDLDGLPATIDALPEVVTAVGGKVPVLVDGGIRRGADVVKALALGATAVQIGRPYLYGLAVGGADGVTRVVSLLNRELRMAMMLLGRPTIASIDRSILW